jgi:hypothetical protein
MNPEEYADPAPGNPVFLDPPTAIRMIRHRILHNQTEEWEFQNRIIQKIALLNLYC